FHVTGVQTCALPILVCGVLAAVAVLGSGMVVLYALGGLGFFMSIMFPTIFSLGIAGLGKETKQASSWLIMAIVGGAIFPYITGGIIDLADDDTQMGYVVPFVCYIVILWFARKGCKPASTT